MRLRTLFAVAALVATPATAAAAGSVSGGPVKVFKVYDVSLHGTDAAKDTLTIVIGRGTLANGQDDILHFTTGVNVVVRGATATVKGSLGPHGAIDMRLQNVRVTPKKLPKGCTGKPGVTRSGQLVGTLRLKMPNGKFAIIKKMPASSSIGGAIDCSKRPSPGRGDGGEGNGDGTGGEPQLVLSSQSDGGVTFSFIATKRSLLLTRVVEPKRVRATTVQTTTSIRAAGSNLLQPSDGGAFAGVTSSGAFTGNGVYRSSMGPGPMTVGEMSGSLKVKMQGVPVISIIGPNAMLQNGDKG